MPRVFNGLVALVVTTVMGCAHTKPGTHVEIVDEDGDRVYVSGAAAPGISQSAACRAAVARAAEAIAMKFSQTYDDEAEDIADAVGVDDGVVFLQRYAKQSAMEASVQDVRFDPVEHVCMAVVRWKPPVFVKEAALQFAQRLKQEELAPAAGAAPSPKESAAAAPAPAAPSSPPPPASYVGAAPQAAAAPRAPACKKEKDRLAKVLKQSRRSVEEFQECVRRSDENSCHRYKLYVEDARQKESVAGRDLGSCFNGGFSSTLQLALGQSLPGHGAVAVESRGDGTVLLWTFSPVEQTAFALEVGPSGTVVGQTPLAANQVQWLKEQLGL